MYMYMNNSYLYNVMYIVYARVPVILMLCGVIWCSHSGWVARLPVASA